MTRGRWWLCAAACALAPTVGSAQDAGPPDSAAALEAARAAQARFERERRTRLPWTVAVGGGACGEVVGRFCWRPDDADRDPPPEPEGIGSARLGLLIELAGLSTRIPRDRWVLGQRVRYRIEGAQAEAARARHARREDPPRLAAARAADSAAAEHLEAAATLAGSCTGDAAPDGWCDGLRGLVLHARGAFVEADAAFDEAGAATPPAGPHQAAGRDLRDLLDADARRLLREAADTAAFLRAFWLLADPFWALPGNDRRTEHEARRVMGRLQEDARNAFGIPWGDDLRELHVRFGWEVGWERTRRSSGALASSGESVVGYQQDDGYGFIPRGAVLGDPGAAKADEWAPREAPRREGYGPPYLDTLVDAEHQLAAFRRGDSILVLTAARLRSADPAAASPEPASRTRPAFAAVVFVPWTASEGVVGTPGAPVMAEALRADDAGAAAPDGVSRTRALLPAGAYVVSVESLTPTGVGARARYGFRRAALAEGVADLSDLLLFTPRASDRRAPRDEEPGSAGDLAAAVRRMVASATVRSGEALGVAWEVYGLRSEGESVEFDVSLRSGRDSFLRRAGRWLGLVGSAEEVAVRWTDAALPVGGVYARTLIVDTPADLEPGRYTLRVTARTAGRSDMRAEREVGVVRE